MEDDKIEIRSDEVQEILGQTPRWLIRWGITVLVNVVIVFLLASWFFKYPEILIAPIVVTTENPPYPVIAKTNGKISELFIADKQKVSSGQYLAYIENPAIFKHFIETKGILDSIRNLFTNSSSTYFISRINEEYSLGDLQSGYSSFIKQFTVYKNFVSLSFHQQKINSLKIQIEKYKYYNDGLLELYKITKNEHLLNKRQFSRDSLLLSQNIISNLDFEKSDKVFLQSKRSLEDAKNALISTQIRINEVKQSILDLELEYIQQKNNIENDLKSEYEDLLSQYAQFEHTYLLKSPVEGKVAFTKYWSTNQNVTTGELVFTIISSQPKDMIGKVKLPIQNSGKVKVGLKVIIKLDNYPYQEFGVLIGFIKSISLVPSDNTYSVEVGLSNGLVSNYGKKLEFTQEMQGTSEIVTEDMRLIVRLIQPIKYIIKKNLN
jgi:HlyD family secretion protein